MEISARQDFLEGFWVLSTAVYQGVVPVDESHKRCYSHERL